MDALDGHTLRVLPDLVPVDGATNMALDETLFESAIDDGQATLRWYQWSEPTVSLGYFQTYTDVPPMLAALPCVRRLTGGGAILHHHDLTYCCALPDWHPFAQHPERLYDSVHDAFQAELNDTLRATSDATNSPAKDDFLCFRRRSSHDLVRSDSKVLGSAQRRKSRAIQQHGSLLVKTSLYAPDLTGFEELSGRTVCYRSLQRSVTRRIASALRLAPQIMELSQREQARATTLVRTRYGTKAWLQRR